MFSCESLPSTYLLGFTKGALKVVRASDFDFGTDGTRSDDEIILGSVNCTGYESNLAECRDVMWNVQCDHLTDAVAVYCARKIDFFFYDMYVKIQK